MIGPDSTRPLRGLPVAVLDFETTGVDPVRCHPVQVAVAVLELGETDPVVVYRSLIRPPISIPPGATEVHRITDADVADAPTMEQVAPILRFLLEERALCAYNLPYDWQILRRWCPDVPFGALDPCVWARTVDKYERSKRLEIVARRRGIKLDAHDAGSDALATARLLPILLHELVRGREAPPKYGRPRRRGPWCKPADLASVAAIWRWTVGAALEQEADLDSYRRRTTGTGIDPTWRHLTEAA